MPEVVGGPGICQIMLLHLYCYQKEDVLAFDLCSIPVHLSSLVSSMCVCVCVCVCLYLIPFIPSSMCSLYGFHVNISSSRRALSSSIVKHSVVLWFSPNCKTKSWLPTATRGIGDPVCDYWHRGSQAAPSAMFTLLVNISALPQHILLHPRRACVSLPVNYGPVCQRRRRLKGAGEPSTPDACSIAVIEDIGYVWICGHQLPSAVCCVEATS